MLARPIEWTTATVMFLSLCSGASAQDTVSGTTFSKDVAAIFRARCESCHQPDSIAPMSLVTYRDARPWARSIKDRVVSRQMPPWHIDPSVGVTRFKNDMSLTEQQIETIVRWVDGGAVEGNPRDLPPPVPAATNEWRAVLDGFGPPDLVIRSPEFVMPARHQDVWFRPSSEIPISEPRWIRMVEIRPTTLKARRVLHHSIAYQVLDPKNVGAVNVGTANGSDGASSALDLINLRPQLMEWAIGKGYDMFRPGTGKLVLPGERISWDLHIHAAGEDIAGSSELGLWFYPKDQEPAKRSHLVGFTGVDRSTMLDIAPNSIAHTDGFTTLKEHTLFTNFQPHFHLRGKAMKVEAILPDGTREVISYIGNFNFNWMTNYIFADDAAPAFPKGTVIHVSAVYDNTRGNRNNPDPDQWVGYGDRTVDEMAHAWMNVVYLTDAEYEALFAARHTATVRLSSVQ